MPKQSKSQNYDALGSIFDFIFKESRKPPVKMRSVEATGISGNDQLTDALASVLERPGVFVTDTVIGTFNGALDVELGSIQFDKEGKVKVTTTNLIDFIKDPGQAIDKSIDRNKAARKASRARYLGEAMEDFITTSWAYKYGNQEVQAAAVANATANEKLESFQVAKAVGQYSRYNVGAPIGKGASNEDLDYMAERSLQLIGRKTFGQDWDTLNTANKEEFILIVSQAGDDVLERELTYPRGQEPQGSVEDIKKYLAKKYNPSVANRFEGAVSNSFEKDAAGRYKKPDQLAKKRITVFDPKLYKAVEDDNLSSRIVSLSGAAPGSKAENERKMYEKTRLLLRMDSEGKRKIKEDIDLLHIELSKTTDKDRRKELKQQIKDSRGAVKVLGYQSAFAQVGRWEAYLGSLQATRATMGPNMSNVAGSILTGDFFDDRKNRYNPVKAKEVGGVEIMVAKDGREGKGAIRGGMGHAYNVMGETLYYMTPSSVVRTFFYNGEGFARYLNRNLNSLDSVLKGVTDLKTVGVSMNEINNAYNTLSGNQLDFYIKNVLGKLSKSKTISPEDMLKVEKLLKRSNTYKNLTHAFSAPFRIQNMLNKKFSDAFKRGRVRVAKMLLKNARLRDLLLKTGGTKLLGKWVTGGGIRLLVKSLVTAAAGAIGLVGTPLASFLVAVGTWIVTDLLMKMVKQAFIMMKYVVMGMLVIIALLVLQATDSVAKFNQRNYSYSNVIPGDVITCAEYTEDPISGADMPPLDPSDPNYTTQCVGGETIQDIYDRVARSMGLSTKLALVTCLIDSSGESSPGHSMCASITWGWCYSAGSIYCDAGKISGASCSTLERLFTHELVHQIQGGNAGYIYGTILREWGADYLSANGGSYLFRTPDGCMRATQVPVPSSCSPSLLQSIARSEAAAYETDCRRYLSNFLISKFCY